MIGLEPSLTPTSEQGGPVEEPLQPRPAVVALRLSRGRIRLLKVTRNERGNRIGESHHNATIPNQVVLEVRRLHEQEGWSCTEIAAKLTLRWRTVRKIINYERRLQVPTKSEREDGNGDTGNV